MDVILANRSPKLLVTLLYIKSPLSNTSRLDITKDIGNLLKYGV